MSSTYCVVEFPSNGRIPWAAECVTPTATIFNNKAFHVVAKTGVSSSDISIIRATVIGLDRDCMLHIACARPVGIIILTKFVMRTAAKIFTRWYCWITDRDWVFHSAGIFPAVSIPVIEEISHH